MLTLFNSSLDKKNYAGTTNQEWQQKKTGKKNQRSNITIEKKIIRSKPPVSHPSNDLSKNFWQFQNNCVLSKTWTNSIGFPAGYLSWQKSRVTDWHVSKKKKKNLNKRFVLTFRAICMQIRFHNLYHDVYTYISNGPLIVKSHEFGNMPKRSQLYSPGWLVLLLTLRRSDIKIFTFFSYLFVNASDPSRLPRSLDGRHGYHLQG